MPAVSTADLNDVWKQLMSEFSALRVEVPFNKNQFKAGLVDIDGELSTTEGTIFNRIRDPAVKSWLQATPAIGRRWIEMMATKRRETL